MKNKSLAKPIVPIQYWQSKKGAHVYFVKRTEIPAVDIDIYFRAGSAWDGKKYGLSYLANAMLNQGTRSCDADAIADKFADVGAHFNRSSGRDYGHVGLKSLSGNKYFNPAFKLFLEILHAVNFPEVALQRKQKQILSLLQMHEQTPSSVAIQAFYSTLYADHPYAHPIEGTKKTVMALTREDAEHFYKKYYVINNATIIIVGDITRQEAEKRVDEIADHLTQGQEVVSIESAVSPKQCGEVHVPFPSEQSNVWMGQLGMNYHDPDYYAMRVANEILGGSSLTSRLFSQVRGKQGLVYGITSAFHFSDATGPFIIHFATQNATAKKALKLVQTLVADYVNKGPSKSEFLRTKKNILNDFPLTIASNHDIANLLSQIGFYKLPIDYIDTFQANIAAVSLEEIKSALKKRIRLDDMIKVIVGS